MMHEYYMQRCLQLAQLGKGYVAPNPLVGALLVHNEIIIGEGYHQQYGQAHAEVNCLNNVKKEDQHLISSSILYVSLEPCAHYGKTPPCVDLIIQHKIPKVVIGCTDPFDAVNGKGIDKLKAAGIEVIISILEDESKHLNKFFFHFHTKHQPYIILKWAQTANGFIAEKDYQRISISNDITNRLVHKWRSEISSILIGTNTAHYDNPSLTNRLWNSNLQPIRLVIDMDLKIPQTHNIFDTTSRTIIFNHKIQKEEDNIVWYKIENENIPQQICNILYKLDIQSVLIEGGAQLLGSFIDANLWNEAIVITNTELHIQEGVSAPLLHHHKYIKQEKLLNDTIQYYQQLSNL